MPDEDGPFDPELVQQVDHVARQILDEVAALRLRRVAVAALGHRDGADIVRQIRQHVLERAPRIRDAVEHHHGHAGGVALFYVREFGHGITSLISKQTLDWMTRTRRPRTTTVERQ